MTSNDLYQEEIKLRLEKSKIYQELRQKSINDEDSGAAALLVTVDKAVSYCYQRSKLVLKHMGEFTLHDGEHLFRVLRLIDYIVPDDSISRLSSPELGLLILTAFFHDVGMAPSESEVKAWLGIWENEIPSPQEMIEHQKYTRFKAGKQIQVAEIAHLRIQEKFSQADIVERYLVTEFIRTTHADRATDIIEKDWNGLIKYKDVDLTSELAVLCNSHNEDGMKLLDLQSSIIAGPNLHICLPFIGVLLRLADLLDFDGNRTPKVLFAHIGVKDPVSLKEWEKHRAVEAWSISPSKIIYNATCNHPAIEYSIREFCDYIDYELVSCASILNNLHDSIRNPFPSYYKINLPNKVDRSQIGPKKDVKGRPVYLYRDTKFTLNKEQIIDILMGTKLYGQPSVALRELVQNSIDACKLRAKMEENWGNSSYIPEIIIRFSKEGIRTYLEVNDNGVGMDQYIIDKFYSKVGSSYYSSSDFLELKSTLKSTFIPTSRFGIGILSCFMISDSIEVETKRIYEAHESSPPLNISIVGQESIFYIKSGTRKTPGTSTKLLLRQDNPWSHAKDAQILSFVKNTVPFPPCNIKIITNDSEINHNIQKPEDLKLLVLADPSWGVTDKFRNIRINFDGSEGIYGACEVAILENMGVPVKNIVNVSEPLKVGIQEFRFTTEWVMGINQYYKKSENIEPESIGHEIKIKPNQSIFRESKSKLALHGVEIPMSMFAHWMGLIYQQAKVQWPICLLININIDGNMDINLNSARTEILIDDKWREFETKIATLICKGIHQSVSPEYWQEFKNVTKANVRNGSNSIFLKALESI